MSGEIMYITSVEEKRYGFDSHYQCIFKEDAGDVLKDPELKKLFNEDSPSMMATNNKYLFQKSRLKLRVKEFNNLLKLGCDSIDKKWLIGMEVKDLLELDPEEYGYHTPYTPTRFEEECYKIYLNSRKDV